MNGWLPLKDVVKAKGGQTTTKQQQNHNKQTATTQHNKRSKLGGFQLTVSCAMSVTTVNKTPLLQWPFALLHSPAPQRSTSPRMHLVARKVNDRHTQ